MDNYEDWDDPIVRRRACRRARARSYTVLWVFLTLGVLHAAMTVALIAWSYQSGTMPPHVRKLIDGTPNKQR